MIVLVKQLFDDDHEKIDHFYVQLSSSIKYCYKYKLLFSISSPVVFLALIIEMMNGVKLAERGRNLRTETCQL